MIFSMSPKGGYFMIRVVHLVQYMPRSYVPCKCFRNCFKGFEFLLQLAIGIVAPAVNLALPTFYYDSTIVLLCCSTLQRRLLIVVSVFPLVSSPVFVSDNKKSFKKLQKVVLIVAMELVRCLQSRYNVFGVLMLLVPMLTV